jgi:hypothetical protein
MHVSRGVNSKIQRHRFWWNVRIYVRARGADMERRPACYVPSLNVRIEPWKKTSDGVKIYT